jgi:hypothetical protein
MIKKSLASLFVSLLLVSCEPIDNNTRIESVKSSENSTESNNLVNPIEKQKSTSSVDYYEKLKSYFPDEGKKIVYEISSGKTDEGIDVNFYVVISKDLIPYVTTVSVLSHRQDTDICEQFFSFDLMKDEKTVYSLSDKKATPEELAHRAEIVDQALNESSVVLADSTLLSCKRFPFFLQDYDLRK